MSQKRNNTGKEFEKMICEENGYIHACMDPKVCWYGEGRSNFDKIKQHNFDPSKFQIDYSKSNFNKYDALNKEGKSIEIKKYSIEDCKKEWKMYSEPFIKIANRSQIKKLKEVFEVNTQEEASSRYNDFLEKLKDYIDIDKFISKMIENLHGVHLIDGLVEKENIEFRTRIKNDWKGFNRLVIEFRVK